MNKFSVVYQSEIKKMFKGKTLFVIAILIVLLIALLTVSFEIILSNKEFLPENSTEITTPEQGIIVYEKIINELNAQNYKPTFNENYLRSCKRMLTYYEFLHANDLSVNEAMPYGALDDMSGLMSGMGYVTAVMQAVLLLAIISIIMFASSNIMGELKSGALKMQLLRPVSRKCMLSAKASAAMTGGLFLYGCATIVAIVYAMIRFNKFMLPQVVFFNNSTATLIPAGGMFAIQFLSGILSMVFYCSLAYAISFLSKSKSSALGFTLGIMVLGSFISMLLGYFYIGYIDPLYNLDFMQAMSASSSIYAGSNVLVSLAIVFGYIALFIVYNCRTFNKSDLN